MPIDSEPFFNRELFNELCDGKQLTTDAERARALGVEGTTVYRVRTGQRHPGLRFANACRQLFGIRAYTRLFPLAKEESRDESE
ncbi:hypothetical protein [Glycomyces sp. NPDC021274]|uniref:hypothetical protein n=1 Tax=Glycomyces sp. NPDC021274 TaxID=3155120 RepID=UPI0033EC278F